MNIHKNKCGMSIIISNTSTTITLTSTSESTGVVKGSYLLNKNIINISASGNIINLTAGTSEFSFTYTSVAAPSSTNIQDLLSTLSSYLSIPIPLLTPPDMSFTINFNGYSFTGGSLGNLMQSAPTFAVGGDLTVPFNPTNSVLQLQRGTQTSAALYLSRFNSPTTQITTDIFYEDVASGIFRFLPASNGNYVFYNNTGNPSSPVWNPTFTISPTEIDVYPKTVYYGSAAQFELSVDGSNYLSYKSLNNYPVVFKNSSGTIVYSITFSSSTSSITTGSVQFADSTTTALLSETGGTCVLTLNQNQNFNIVGTGTSGVVINPAGSVTISNGSSSTILSQTSGPATLNVSATTTAFGSNVTLTTNLISIGTAISYGIAGITLAGNQTYTIGFVAFNPVAKSIEIVASKSVLMTAGNTFTMKMESNQGFVITNSADATMVAVNVSTNLTTVNTTCQTGLWVVPVSGTCVMKNMWISATEFQSIYTNVGTGAYWSIAGDSTILAQYNFTTGMYTLNGTMLFVSPNLAQSVKVVTDNTNGYLTISATPSALSGSLIADSAMGAVVYSTISSGNGTAGMGFTNAASGSLPSAAVGAYSLSTGRGANSALYLASYNVASTSLKIGATIDALQRFTVGTTPILYSASFTPTFITPNVALNVVSNSTHQNVQATFSSLESVMPATPANNASWAVCRFTTTANLTSTFYEFDVTHRSLLNGDLMYVNVTSGTSYTMAFAGGVLALPRILHLDFTGYVSPPSTFTINLPFNGADNIASALNGILFEFLITTAGGSPNTVIIGNLGTDTFAGTPVPGQITYTSYAISFKLYFNFALKTWFYYP